MFTTLKHMSILVVLSVAAVAQFQQAELSCPNNQAVGVSLSVAGNTVASASKNGSVCLFKRIGADWKRSKYVATLSASDGSSLSTVSIADNGTVVVAGEPLATVGGNPNQGAAYVFVEPATGWADATETAKLTASDGSANDNLGFSVSVNAAEVVAGAPGFETGQGAAYVYTEPKGGWVSGTETARLSASDGQASEFFGEAVSVNGPRIAVGASQAVHAQNEGTVYVFQEPIGGWTDMTETAQLTENVRGLEIGSIVSEVGDTIATGYWTSGSSSTGAVVYVEPAGGWVSTDTPTAFLTVSDLHSGSGLSESLGLNSDAIILGYPLAASGWHFRKLTGAAYEFVKPASGWATTQGGVKMIPKNGKASGASVAMQDRTVFIGSPNAPVNETTQGAVFVFSGVKPD